MAFRDVSANTLAPLKRSRNSVHLKAGRRSTICNNWMHPRLPLVGLEIKSYSSRYVLEVEIVVTFCAALINFYPIYQI